MCFVETCVTQSEDIRVFVSRSCANSASFRPCLALTGQSSTHFVLPLVVEDDPGPILDP